MNRIGLSDGPDLETVTMSTRDPTGPGAEFRRVPFEAVVVMAQFAGAETGKCRVMSAVRRRHHDDTGARITEQGRFERRQPRGFDMLDHLHQGGGIETAPAPVSIGEAARLQLHPPTQGLARMVQIEPRMRGLQQAQSGIDPENPLDCRRGQKAPDQAPLATAEIEHAHRPGLRD